MGDFSLPPSPDRSPLALAVTSVVPVGVSSTIMVLKNNIPEDISRDSLGAKPPPQEEHRQGVPLRDQDPARQDFSCRTEIMAHTELALFWGKKTCLGKG